MARVERPENAVSSSQGVLFVSSSPILSEIKGRQGRAKIDFRFVGGNYLIEREREREISRYTARRPQNQNKKYGLTSANTVLRCVRAMLYDL